MNNEAHISALTSTARWCRKQYEPMTTGVTGKPKKPPTYWIVKCPACGLGLTSSKEVTYESKRANRMKCVRLVPAQPKSKGTSSSYPASKRCKRQVELVKEIGEQE